MLFGPDRNHSLVIFVGPELIFTTLIVLTQDC